MKCPDHRNSLFCTSSAFTTEHSYFEKFKCASVPKRPRLWSSCSAREKCGHLRNVYIEEIVTNEGFTVQNKMCCSIIITIKLQLLYQAIRISNT